MFYQKKNDVPYHPLLEVRFINCNGIDPLLIFKLNHVLSLEATAKSIPQQFSTSCLFFNIINVSFKIIPDGGNARFVLCTYLLLTDHIRLSTPTHRINHILCRLILEINHCNDVMDDHFTSSLFTT